MSDPMSTPIADELLKFTESKSDVLDAGDVAVVERIAQAVTALEERIHGLDESLDKRAVDAVNREVRDAQREIKRSNRFGRY